MSESNEEIRKLICEHGTLRTDNGFKSVLLMAYLDILLEHKLSIALLLRFKFYGSAFALVRPVFETFYRGMWIARCATAEQIEQVAHGGKFPSMTDLARAIDAAQLMPSTWFSDFKGRMWSGLSSYTHSGLHQVSRRFVRQHVRPRYTAAEVKGAIYLVEVSTLLFADRFFRTVKWWDDVEQIGAMIDKFLATYYKK